MGQSESNKQGSFLFHSMPVGVSPAQYCRLWLMLVSNKWKGHQVVTSRLSDVAEKWETAGIKPGLWFSLEASFGDGLTLHFCLCANVTPYPLTSSTRIRATFCLCRTIEPFLAWYFHNVFARPLRTHVHTALCEQRGLLIQQVKLLTWCFKSCGRYLLRDL